VAVGGADSGHFASVYVLPPLGGSAIPWSRRAARSTRQFLARTRTWCTGVAEALELAGEAKAGVAGSDLPMPRDRWSRVIAAHCGAAIRLRAERGMASEGHHRYAAPRAL
jgi:hypothetical protein